jgi:hypothetical protein
MRTLTDRLCRLSFVGVHVGRACVAVMGVIPCPTVDAPFVWSPVVFHLVLLTIHCIMAGKVQKKCPPTIGRAWWACKGACRVLLDSSGGFQMLSKPIPCPSSFEPILL